MSEDDEDLPRQARVEISRPALTSDQFDELYHELDVNKQSHKQLKALWGAGRSSCSKFNLLTFLLSFVPIVRWLPAYKWSRDLGSDLVAGFTVAVMHIPQGMAYGMLAGVDPVVGIYTAFFPVLVYFVMGSMSHVSMGTFAVVSILVSKPVLKLGTDITEESVKGSGVEEEFSRLEVATAVTLCVGLVQTGLGLIRLGSLTVVLTDVLISAFTVGASFHVLTSQVKHVLGVEVPFVSGAGRFVKTYLSLGEQLTDVNLVTLAISTSCLAVLLTMDQYVGPRLKGKCKFPLPTQLGLVILFTSISLPLGLSESHKVRTIQDIGEIPLGLPSPQLPSPSLMSSVAIDSLPVAVVAFVIGQGLGSMFGEKHGYKVLPNQELVAQGVSNIVGSMFSCIPMAGSLSRSLVQEASGCRTQLTSLVSALLLLAVLLLLGPLFLPLPVSVLASIILASLVGILRKVADVQMFWARSRWDGFLWCMTFFSTVFVDVDFGLIIGVITSLFLVTIRSSIPKIVVLIKQGEVWLDKYQYCCLTPKDSAYQKIKVLQVKGPLNFLTVSFVTLLISQELDEDTSEVDDETESLLMGQDHTCAELSSGEEEDHVVPGSGSIKNAQMKIDKPVRKEIVVLDISGTTWLDNRGCGLVEWVEKRVEIMGLVADQDTLEVLQRHQLLKRLKCKVFPSYMDAISVLIMNKTAPINADLL